MGSATSSCLRNTVKLGTKKAMENRRSRDPGEICITLLTMTLDRNSTMMVPVNAPLKPSLKIMHRNSG